VELMIGAEIAQRVSRYGAGQEPVPLEHSAHEAAAQQFKFATHHMKRHVCNSPAFEDVNTVKLSSRCIGRVRF